MIRRLLFATPHVHFPQGGGGSERNTHELCLALRARGIEPGVWCSLGAHASLLTNANRLKRFLLCQHFPRDRGCGYPVFRGWDWTDAGAAEVMARFRPDLAIVQMLHPEPLLRILAARGIPSAVYVHEVESIDDLGPLGREGVPFLANSQFTAARLREQCGIDADIIRPLIEPRYYVVTAPRRERALFINTVPRKGLEIVLRLAQSRPDIPFDLVLNWVLKPNQVEALSKRAAVAGNITLHPPTPDMRPLYARARLLLAPSQWEEAWGRVVTEAHLNGIPVLASSRGGLPELVGPGGILLPADAPHAAWLAALGQLWDDPEAYARYSAAAASYALRGEIRPANIVDEFCCLLPKLMRGRVEGCAPIEAAYSLKTRGSGR